MGGIEDETRQSRSGATLYVGRIINGNDLVVRDTGTLQCHLAIEFLPLHNGPSLTSAHPIQIQNPALTPALGTPRATWQRQWWWWRRSP